MNIQILNRWTGAIILTVDAPNLRGANLRYADLRDADLQDADLRKADLRYADLRCADLQGADLRYANLRCADLRYANLRKADLRCADLQDADLRYADLQRANLQGADLDFSCWPLCCGSLTAIIDDRLAAQLLYHIISVVGVDKFTDSQITLANTFHRAECPRLERTTPDPVRLFEPKIDDPRGWF